jgi:hypothetical protein
VLINFERLSRARVKRSIEQIGTALAASIRDTDITGWHRNRSTIGVIFTSLTGTSRAATRTAVSGQRFETPAAIAAGDAVRHELRDLRVRWALEEAGLPYKVRPVSFREMKEPAYLALNPFDPATVKDAMKVFEAKVSELEALYRLTP